MADGVKTMDGAVMVDGAPDRGVMVRVSAERGGGVVCTLYLSRDEAVSLASALLQASGAGTSVDVPCLLPARSSGESQDSPGESGQSETVCRCCDEPSDFRLDRCCRECHEMGCEDVLSP